MMLIKALRQRFYKNSSARLGLLLKLIILIALTSTLPSVTEAVAATYQGFGAGTPGGQGKPVYHVTNLNDSGPGSLRDALSQGNRQVVFDVAGEILLTNPVEVRGAFITIDGFTAPSPGITLKNYGLALLGNKGAHDVIVTGIRVRNSLGDGITIKSSTYNVVLDHVSIQGSADGNIDITRDTHDITISWSILAEPAGTQKNLLIKYDNPRRITLHHNIFVVAMQRNPQVRIDDLGTPATDTTLHMENNLIWDWGNGEGTRVWYGPRANIVNNFYSNPSGSASAKKQALIVCQGACNGGNPASAARAYVAGNFSNDGFSDHINSQGTESAPFPAPLVDATDACTAAHWVIAGAGVTPLDVVDQQYLSAISLPSCNATVNPTVAAVPGGLSFAATMGGPNPASKQLMISDSSNVGLPWTATTGAAWFSVSSVSGTTPSAVAVAVNASGLSEGSYSGAVRIAAPGGANSPVLVPVTLTVSAATVTPPPVTPLQITAPSPGSVLPGSSVTFKWTAVAGNVQNWRLYLGSSQGARDLYRLEKFGGKSTTSRTVSDLPTDGRTIWLRLGFQIDGSWQLADFQYRAALK